MKNTITMLLVNVLMCTVTLKSEEVFLPDIIVKGELQEKNMQDSQTSMVVLEGKELDQSTDANLYDVVKRTAGITSISGERGFSIRGISSREAINTTLDGMTIPTERASVLGPYGTWDLEQVEILRGAQSTQSGRNALAGAINIRTANPTFEQASKIRFDIGSKNSKSVALMHNQPLIDDVLAVRIAGEISNADGWITNTTLNDDLYNANEMKMFRIKLLWKPVENLKVLLGYSVTNNESGDDTVEYATWPKHYYNRANIKAYEGTVSRVSTLNLEYTINENWSIKSLTGQYLSDYTYIQDLDLRPKDYGFWDEKEKGNTFTQELKLVYASKHVRAVFGFFYTKIKRDANDGIVNVPGGFLESSLDAFNIVAQINTLKKQNIENKAIFGEVEYDLSEYWTLLAGIRYDSESLENESAIIGKITDPGLLPPSFIPGIEALINSQTKHETKNSAFLTKLGLRYHISEHEDLGLNYKEGYRPGGSDLNPFTQMTYEYNPEYTDTVEFSYRFKSANKKTTFNTNIFYTKWKDMQVFVQSPGNIHNTYIDNSGSSTLYGAELSASHYFSDTFNVFLTAGYVHTKFDNYVSYGQDYSGNQFAFAPEITVSIGSKYYFTDNWCISGDLNYQSESYSSPSNTSETKIEAYTVFNAQLGYETDTWSVFLYGRNLGNERYATQYYLGSTGTREFVKMGKPRFVGLRCNVNF